MFFGVRGAITVSNNQADEIRAGTKELVETLIKQNNISVHQIVSVFFTLTPDLTALNPARAIREARNDWQFVPMLCAQEPVIEGMLPRCIRVLIQWAETEHQNSVTPVYLKDARKLRPELSTNQEK